MSLSIDEITKLLSKNEPAKPPQQYGPLRWVDKELRCASRGCSSPTHCKVEYVPYCMKHALGKLNDLVIEMTGERNDAG